MDSFGTLLSIYCLERLIFRWMLMIGMEAQVSSTVIGFWLSLESLGHSNLVRRIATTQNNMTLALVAGEALAALSQIESDHHDDHEITDASNAYLPMISYIAEHHFTLDHFYINRRVFRERLSQVLYGVCNVIFRDIWDYRASHAQRYSEFIGPVRPFGEGVRTAGPVVPPITLPIRSDLNPFAQPWTPQMAQLGIPVEQRTLFLTFSIGYPLNENEIHNFFTGIYGSDCIENIYVNHPTQGEGGPSLFGKVVFRSSTTIEYVMNGEEVVKLTTAGKPLWCRRFDQRNQGRWRRRMR